MSTEWLEFAKAALTGILANGTTSSSPKTVAEIVCEYADAMLAEINRRYLTVTK